MPPSVVIVTHIPSPYQVELFDALAASGRVMPRVIYARQRNEARQWNDSTLRHEYVIHEVGTQAAVTARDWIDASDLVVFSFYSDTFARQLIRRRAATGLPWCLWGERPGAKWGLVGKLRRRFYLADLARSEASIWGIGQWAIEGWQQEFGKQRCYKNVPYFSDLERFQPRRLRRRDGTRTILFSGSLILRKGIDLLAKAFVRIGQRRPNIRLEILGGGPLEESLRAELAPVAEQVRFLGFRQWHELPEHYWNADILCAPSRYDGWGLIIPEGLAAGLPVIATDRMGAALDLIRPGENGWIVKADDLTALESAVNTAVDLPDENLVTMRAAALSTAASHRLEDGVERFCEAAARTMERPPVPLLV